MRFTAVAALALAAGLLAAPVAHALEIDPLTKQQVQQLDDARTKATPIPRETVAYTGRYAPGTIIGSTEERRLYFVLGDGKALRYGVGVGRPGFEWGGAKTIVMKREWPDWRPPAQMLKRRPDLPRYMPGGEANPLAPAPCILAARSTAFMARTSLRRSARLFRPAVSAC